MIFYCLLLILFCACEALNTLIVIIIRVLRVDVAAHLLLAELALAALYAIAIQVGETIESARYYHLNQSDN